LPRRRENPFKKLASGADRKITVALFSLESVISQIRPLKASPPVERIRGFCKKKLLFEKLLLKKLLLEKLLFEKLSWTALNKNSRCLRFLFKTL
jgi:hypothetical protein